MNLLLKLILIDQKLSELMISLPLRVPRARQVATLIDVLKNRTEPSAMVTLTPPGWRLLAVVLIRCGGNMHDRVFGPLAW